jgi:hypothetical protein
VFNHSVIQNTHFYSNFSPTFREVNTPIVSFKRTSTVLPYALHVGVGKKKHLYTTVSHLFLLQLKKAQDVKEILQQACGRENLPQQATVLSLRQTRLFNR